MTSNTVPTAWKTVCVIKTTRRHATLLLANVTVRRDGKEVDVHQVSIDIQVRSVRMRSFPYSVGTERTLEVSIPRLLLIRVVQIYKDRSTSS